MHLNQQFYWHSMRYHPWLTTFAAVLCFQAANAGTALAKAGAWAGNERVEARLVSAVEASGDLAHLPLGLHLKLKPGWKAYWRSPGEAGLPPQLDFGTSANVAGFGLSYPIPHRFTVLGINSFGYKGEVVLPLDLAVASPGSPLDLSAKLDLLVCSDICVPDTLKLILALPDGGAVPGEEAALVNRFAAMVPGNGQASGLAIGQVRMMGSGKPSMLEVAATAREPFVNPDIFPEAEDGSFGQPLITVADGGHSALIQLPVLRQGAGPLRLTLADGQRAVEAQPLVEAAPEPSWSARVKALLPMLGVALLGGFVLNFMPCVLPVLSLKLLSVVRQGGRAQAEVRRGFLAAAAGILASFLALALALIGLRAGGQTIGWGIQFQQPMFLTVMILLLTLFACNMAGFFEIPLPASIANRFGKAGDSGLLGHFASGAFATLLATPCSAPFLGTAVGFALTGGAPETLAIFLALGAGLASPWLLVAAKPALAARLPRPGPWMAVLRQVLGLALLATAVWLLSVMSAQAGLYRASLVAAAMVIGALSLLAWRFAPQTRLLAMAAAVAGPAFVTAALAASFVAKPFQGGAEQEAGWERFDADAIKSLVSQGRTVMVDITADWCLTCQANKRLVLERGPVGQLLASKTIVPMKGDWTRPDPQIAAFLARYGRYGIPFNIVYGPAAPAGIVLPELLTDAAVTDAVARARGS